MECTVLDDLVAAFSCTADLGEDISHAPAFAELDSRINSFGADPVDWQSFAGSCKAVLRDEAKDLRIVCWLCFSVVKLYGFSGIQAGASLLSVFFQAFGEKAYYPVNSKARYNALLWLSKKYEDWFKENSSLSVSPETKKQLCELFSALNTQLQQLSLVELNANTKNMKGYALKVLSEQAPEPTEQSVKKHLVIHPQNDNLYKLYLFDKTGQYDMPVFCENELAVELSSYLDNDPESSPLPVFRLFMQHFSKTPFEDLSKKFKKIRETAVKPASNSAQVSSIGAFESGSAVAPSTYSNTASSEAVVQGTHSTTQSTAQSSSSNDIRNTNSSSKPVAESDVEDDPSLILKNRKSEFKKLADFWQSEQIGSPYAYLLRRLCLWASYAKPEGKLPPTFFLSKQKNNELSEKLANQQYEYVLNVCEEALFTQAYAIDLNYFSAMSLKAMGHEAASEGIGFVTREFCRNTLELPQDFVLGHDAENAYLTPETAHWLSSIFSSALGRSGGSASNGAVSASASASISTATLDTVEEEFGHSTTPSTPSVGLAEEHLPDIALLTQNANHEPLFAEIAHLLEGGGDEATLEAMALVAKAAAASASGRDRFLLQLKTTQLMLELKMNEVALANLENLEACIQQHDLERWEPDLIVQASILTKKLEVQLCDNKKSSAVDSLIIQRLRPLLLKAQQRLSCWHPASFFER